MIHRDHEGWYFRLRLTRRLGFVLIRWNEPR